MSAPKMKGIHHKTRISISTLRLILATGIGLFLGIQFRLLAHTLSSPTQQTEEPLIQPLNATGLRQAIRKLQQQSPLFLFGHTTGHSGSGTFQESLAQPGCFWDITVDKFEYVTEDEKTWANDVKGYDDNCDLTKSKLMPHLTGAIKRKARKLRLVDVQDEDDDDEVEGTVFSNATIAEQLEVLKKELGQQSAAFIDLGHFHNTGRTLECLAKLLGEHSVFVHIRRNRYSIARSFTPDQDERLNKTDWRRVKRENKMLMRRVKFQSRLDDEQVDVMRRIVGSGRRRGADTRNDDDDGDVDEDEVDKETSHRRLDDEDAQSKHKGSPTHRVDQQENWTKKRKRHKAKKRSYANRSHETSLEDRVNQRMSVFRKNNDEENSSKERKPWTRPCRGKRCHDKNESKIALPQTPCLALDVINGKNMSHPSVSICPRSTEGRGPVDLPVSNDDIWDSLTPFQQFLWYADEMEHRWYTLQKMFYSNYKIAPEYRRHVPGGGRKPTFIEVTWDDKEELHDGVNWVREQLGCTPAMFLTNEHPHVKHEHGALNCSQFIWEDLEYRKKMKFSSKTSVILFPHSLPQHVDSPECQEGRAELEAKIRKYSMLHGIPYDPGQWKLPDE